MTQDRIVCSSAVDCCFWRNLELNKAVDFQCILHTMATGWRPKACSRAVLTTGSSMSLVCGESCKTHRPTLQAGCKLTGWL